MTDHKPILCLDFDGVCHSYTSGWINAWTIPDPPVPGLFAFIEDAFKHFRICIYSSRSEFALGRAAMARWFMQEALGHYEDAKIARTLVDQLEFSVSKPSAFVTLDDRAITFKGEWPDIGMLRGFVTWNDHLIKKAPRNTVVKNG